MQKKIKLFHLIAGFEQATFTCPMIQLFNERYKDYEVKVFCISKWDYNLSKSYGLNAVYLYDLFPKKIPDNIEQELEKIEKKYNINYISNLIVGDLEASMLPRKKALILLYKHLSAWIGVFKKEKPDMIIGGLERFFYQSCQEICKEFNVPYYLLYGGIPIPNSGFLLKIQGKNYEIMPELIEKWNVNKNKKLSNDERKKSENYVNSVISEKNKFLLFNSKPSFSPRLIFFFFKMCYRSFIIEKNRILTLNIYRGTKFYIKKIFMRYLNKLLYKKVNTREKYIFFPLHDPRECQLTVSAQPYVDQYYLLKNIANSMPTNVKLYVKEHPNALGVLSHSYLKKINKLPNVKLIKPLYPSKRLIRNAECVMVINSTVGWESILLQKPLLTFGRSFYEASGLCKPVRDLFTISESIKEVMENNPGNKEMTLRFVNTLFQLDSFHADWRVENWFFKSEKIDSNVVLNKKNIEGFATEFHDVIENIRKKSGQKSK